MLSKFISKSKLSYLASLTVFPCRIVLCSW